MRWITSLLLLVAPSGASAQGLVLPAGHDAVEGNAIASAFFALGNARHQWIVNGTQLQTLGNPWSIREVWFRRDMTTGRTLPGGSLDVELWASDTTASPRGPSPRFADNRGLGHTVRRYAGRLVLPPIPGSATIPAAWNEQTGEAIRLPLVPPLVGTNNLCIELVTRTVTGQAVPTFWVDAASAPDTATSRVIGTSCAIGGFVPRTTVSVETLIPGSSTLLRLADVPPGRLAVSLLGFNHQSWSGVPLPLPLDQVGAPGCSLYTDWVHVMATITAHPVPGWYSGQAYRRFQLPLDPTLLGGTFYSQWLIFEQGINPLGAVTTHGLEARLASAFPSFEIATVESTDPQAQAGRVLQHFVPVLRLVP